MKEIHRSYLPIKNIKFLMRTIVISAFVFITAFLCPDAFAQEFPFLGAVKVKGVNVRSGQSQSFEAVAQLDVGEKVVVVDKDYSWYKIKLPLQAQSYVSADFVLKTRDNVGAVTGERVNIRARKAVESTILGQLHKSDLVRIRATSDQWVQIEPIDESFGWVHEDLIEFSSKTLPPPRTVELPTRNIYERKRMLAQQQVPENQAQEPVQALKPRVSEPPPVPEPKPQQENVIKVTGVIQALGDRSITQNIRHQIQGEDKQIYYLKGYRSILDTFLNYKVHIEAELLSDIQAPAPVVLVRKIQLIL